MASPALRFDSDSGRLWYDEREVALRPKSLAVLRYLMAHPGRVVSKEELLAVCWPDVQVSPAALKVCIRDIRATLGDDVATPQFIETLSRQGYRFIGAVVSREKEEKHRAEATDPRPLSPNPQTEAEACFLKAIEIAQRQQAKSLELRATVSLARL